MVAVVRHKFSGLSACFNDTSTLFELVPDAVDLNVEKFGWCAHGESSVVSRPIFISLFAGGRSKIISKLCDKTFSRPPPGFSQCPHIPPPDFFPHPLNRVPPFFPPPLPVPSLRSF